MVKSSVFDQARRRVCRGGAAMILGLALAWGTTIGVGAQEHEHARPAAPASLTAGPVREVVLPEGLGSAQSITLDSSGRLWFTEKVGKKLSMYDPEKKEFASYSLPASWGNVGFSQVTAGPDDVLWFTVNRWAEGGDEPYLLGRFEPKEGYFTRLAVPNRAIPQEIMVDARGAIWFFAANKNHLYRIDAKSFALKGYPVPTANGHPRSLAASRDGHIWFVEANTNKIGEFIPDQEQFREYDVLTSFSNPGRLSIDALGRIWFVQVTANRIGVFTPERKRFDEVIVPTPGSAPVALAHDDQGNVWFIEYKGNKVGVFNPQTAVFREFDIPTYGALPSEMVVDRARGRLWFTQSATDAKRLGTLVLAEALQAGFKAETNDAAPTVAAKGERGGDWVPLGLAILALLAGVGTWLAWRGLKRRGQAG